MSKNFLLNFQNFVRARYQPLIKRYLIVLFGRVPRPDVPKARQHIVSALILSLFQKKVYSAKIVKSFLIINVFWMCYQPLKKLYLIILLVMCHLKMVGMTGFEPATPTSRTWCATKLRYIPMFIVKTKTYVFVGALPTSHKTILNRFVRQSATSRCAKRQHIVPALILSLFQKKVYFAKIVKSFLIINVVWVCYQPLTKQYLIVLFSRVLHPNVPNDNILCSALILSLF